MAKMRPLLRILTNILLDAGVALVAVPLAGWIAAPQAAALPPWTWVVGAGCLLIGGAPFGLSRQYWRFAGLGDLVAVASGSLLGGGLFSVALWLLDHRLPSPTFPLIFALCLLVLLAAPRIAYRTLQQRDRGNAETGQRRVVLVGSGDGADLFLRALAGETAPGLRVIGLLALSPRQTGRRIQGCPILGPVAAAGPLLAGLRAQNRGPDTLVITGHDLSGPDLTALLDTADELGIPVRRAPHPTTLQPPGTAQVAPMELRPLLIEDLLDRPQVSLDRDGMARLVQGRRVLVTGAGGTIGSELARQVASLGPEEIVLLDNGEYALWQIDLELAEQAPDVPRKALIADVRDGARIRAILEKERPHLVFHAAALKHVPMVESNPLEGLQTNVVGTQHVADAARAAGCLAMVFISTDKAVNPTSLMGASKRLAEMYCQALDISAQTGSGQTGSGQAGGMRCITVRFGNVLGSTGSVVPLFRRQLERGGPLTVTHPDMQRYFMTVREAVGLVLQASVVGTTPSAALPGGREGGIFVLDMGPAVKIVELARRMIRLAGLVPERDVQIRFTGLRPGEKLYEELFHGTEPPVPTGYDGLLMAVPRTADPAIVGRAIEEIAATCRTGQTSAALATLGRMVPEFDHQTGATRLGGVT